MARESGQPLMDKLEAPNHLVPLYLAKKLAYDSEHTGAQYPLVNLLVPESPGAGTPERLVFVAKPYRISHWSQRDSSAPPTWMDPEVFIRQVKARTDVFEQAAKIAEKKRPEHSKKLVAPLKQAFHELYIPYIEQQFCEIAVPLLAEWLVAHCAFQQSVKVEK